MAITDQLCRNKLKRRLKTYPAKFSTVTRRRLAPLVPNCLISKAMYALDVVADTRWQRPLSAQSSHR